jgi:CRP/FNR family transcriptional regulator, cyclic AMP receptor protein
MEDLQRVLREHAFLEGLSAEQDAVLVGCAKNVRFEPGDLLLREGDAADTFFLLRVGEVALELHVPGRGAVQMEKLGPGDVLGLSWLSPPHRVQLDARAVWPVVALAFDGACLRRKMEADPRLGFVLVKKVLAETIKRLQRVRLQRADVYKAG